MAVVYLGLARGAPLSAAAGLGAITALACRPRPAPGFCLERDTSGRWHTGSAGDVAQLQPAGLPTLLPWVVHLPFTAAGSGARRDVWVFRDAVTREQWRQLRVRLNVNWRGASPQSRGARGL